MERVRVDLHVHTTASDGRRTPQQVVAEACARGLDAIAVTDHDTTAGVAAARQAAAGTGLFVVPGVELSVDFAGELHILGLFVDVDNAEFSAAMARLRQGRLRRVEKIVARLNALGVPLALSDVMAQMRGDSVGRGHVAYAMVAKKLARDTDEAFARYLEIGRPAYVPNARLSLAQALGLLQRTGALSVWAHPMKTATQQQVLVPLYEQMKRLGLGGVECFHPSADAQQTRMLERWCLRDGLFVTGGSDWHDKAGGVPLGWVADRYDVTRYDPAAAQRIAHHARFFEKSDGKVNQEP